MPVCPDTSISPALLEGGRYRSFMNTKTIIANQRPGDPAPAEPKFSPDRGGRQLSNGMGQINADVKPENQRDKAE